MEALATKYRPQKFQDVVCQDNVKKVLVNQLETGEFKQAYLFTGGAGTGKTTSARIFANEVNKGKGRCIEIDGASNNGVDNIRDLIENTKMKSLDGTYKVYIIDEVHMLSQGAFNALLKVLEEPPKGVIFILCTTDPQKIPATILSRCQRFDFRRIPSELIIKRLEYIIQSENEEICERQGNEVYEGDLIEYDIDALEYIAKLANGGMRDAIMKLDTVLGYTQNIRIDKVLDCLGISSYQIMIELIKDIIQGKPKDCMELLEALYMEGKDLKVFIRDLTRFVLDLCKINYTNNYAITSIPTYMQKDITALVQVVNIMDFVDILNTLHKLNGQLRTAIDVRTMVESEVLLLCY